MGYHLNRVEYAFFMVVAALTIQTFFESFPLFAFLMFLFSLYASLNTYHKGCQPALYYFILVFFCAASLGVAALFQESGDVSATVADVAMLSLVLSALISTLLTGYKIKTNKKDAETILDKQTRHIEMLIADRTQQLKLEKMQADQQSKRLQLALRELNHRVINNLAIVSSLLNIQSNTITQPEAHSAIQESRRRIDAMGLIHQQLYQSEEVTDIDIPAFITNLIQLFVEAYGFSNQRFNYGIDLQPLIWPVEKAIPVGLLINEVLTNAFKHGLTHVQSPSIHVKLTVGDKLLIEIQDNGPGMDSVYWQNQAHSFGHMLIEALSKQLKGQYEIFNQGGTCFRLWLPVN